MVGLVSEIVLAIVCMYAYVYLYVFVYGPFRKLRECYVMSGHGVCNGSLYHVIQGQ